MDEVRKSPFFGILADEVTDISNVQNLVIFIKYYDHEKGEAQTAYIDSTDLLSFSETNLADSQTIHDCLINLISNLKLQLPNLKAFSSDGASAMTGFKGDINTELRERQSLKHLLNAHCVYHRLALACADSSDQLNFLKEFELTLTQLWAFFNNSPKRLNIYLKTAHKIHNIETLHGSKRKDVVKKVKKAVNTRWFSLHASVDAVYEEYVGLLETFSILETEGGSGGSMANGFSKLLQSPKFIGMLYTLIVMVPSLTALSKAFQTRAISFFIITTNIEKTKSKLQQILDEQKPLMLLKTDMKNMLQRCNLKVHEQAEETIHSMTERYTKTMLWNIDDRFSHVLSILEAFSIFNLDNIPTNITSSEFSVYGHSEINVLPNHFFANDEENKDSLIRRMGKF